jgi:hypothetical protein
MNLPLENNPIRHVQKIKAQMHQIINQIREDVGTVTEANAQVIFKTSAEVLGGLVKTYDEYEEKSQKAWRTKLMASIPKEKAIHA